MTLLHEAISHNRKFVRLQLPNRLDLDGSAVLKRQLEATKPEPGNVWGMDMAPVEFVDSAGILALVSALTFARSVNCRLLAYNLRPSIRLIFEITQLDQAIEIADGSPQSVGVVA